MKISKMKQLLESASKQYLLEGVKIGRKEIEETLNNSSDFLMGIEYEFDVNNTPDASGDRTSDTEELIDKYSIPHIDRVVTEHDDMVEVITKPMPPPIALKHIKTMFEISSNENIEFPDYAGMHISISHKQHASKQINFAKFLVLLSSGYLHTIFPERNYVKDVQEGINEAITDTFSHKDEFDINDIETAIEDHLSSGHDEDVKYITVKIADYVKHSGRIELRFFGGKDYHEQYDEIRWQALRALFILGVAYEEDMYKDEYHKALYKMFMNVMDEGDGFEVLMFGKAMARHSDLELYFDVSRNLNVKYAREILANKDKITPERMFAFVQYFDMTGINQAFIPSMVDAAIQKEDIVGNLERMFNKSQDTISSKNWDKVKDKFFDRFKTLYMNDPITNYSSTFLKVFGRHKELDDFLLSKKHERNLVPLLAYSQAYKHPPEFVDDVLVPYIKKYGIEKSDETMLSNLSRLDVAHDMMVTLLTDSSIDDENKTTLIKSFSKTGIGAGIVYDRMDELSDVIDDEMKMNIKKSHIYGLFNDKDNDPETIYSKYEDDIKELIEVSTPKDIFALLIKLEQQYQAYMSDDVKSKVTSIVKEYMDN